MTEAVCKFRLDLQIVLAKMKKYVGERVGKAETFHFKVFPEKKRLGFLFVCVFVFKSSGLLWDQVEQNLFYFLIFIFSFN